MAAFQGACPNCGAPIQFAIGSSMAKVCEFCRHTVVRSDRGLGQIGKCADLAPTSSLIGVGDEGALGGRPMRVLGRVQLDHGAGPWDEYYVAFDYGQAWGWLAYAQGRWYATMLVPAIAVPGFDALAPERDVVLGQAGSMRVAEVRTGRIVSAEGELPGSFPPGFVRHYADLYGKNSAFATIDYGDRKTEPAVYLGWMFPESALAIVQLGPGSAQKVKTTTLRCPACGGDVPALAGDRSERLGCPYCGAVSDIPSRTVLSQQEVARQQPIIPIGARGTLNGVSYVVCALVRRGSDFDGELYEWEEFLLWSATTGYEWLVHDPESGWSRTTFVNPAELDLRAMPNAVHRGKDVFRSRNRNTARVTYVLGEVYWKCQVGETTEVSDFNHGVSVLSREESPGEVSWSFSERVPWPVIARAFGVPVEKGQAQFPKESNAPVYIVLAILIIITVVVLIFVSALPSSGVAVGGGTFRGGGVYSGGK